MKALGIDLTKAYFLSQQMNGLGEVDGTPSDISTNENGNVHTGRNKICVPSGILGFRYSLTPTVING